jgi:hypothetical protein
MAYVSQSSKATSNATFSSLQESPPIEVPLPVLDGPWFIGIPQQVKFAHDQYAAGDLTSSLSTLESISAPDFRVLYIRGYFKLLCAKQFPTIMTSITAHEGACCCQKTKVYPVPDTAATMAQKAGMLKSALDDMTLAFKLSADAEGADPKFRSEISTVVATLYMEFNDECRLRAYVSRALELNPDNMEARMAHEAHKKPVHFVEVQTQTHVTSTAIASASAHASSSSSSRASIYG